MRLFLSRPCRNRTRRTGRFSPPRRSRDSTAWHTDMLFWKTPWAANASPLILQSFLQSPAHCVFFKMKAVQRVLATMMRHEKCLAGVNGGYFDENFAPIGLRIANGQMIAPLQRARLITGVLVASPRGVQIVRSREFSRRLGVSCSNSVRAVSC